MWTYIPVDKYLSSFFWVIPRCLNFICQCFGTLCLCHIRRRRKKEEFLPTYTAYEDGADSVFQNIGI